MKKIFLTGISGLLGTNLANELLRQGYYLKAIIRNPSAYTGHQSDRLELIKMDLSGDYEPYLRDIDIIVHMAAETSVKLTRLSDYEKINVDATVRLFESSKKMGVRQFIFISTANTIGYGNLKLLGDENFRIKKPFDKLYYAKSKLRAEKYLIKNADHIQLKILNPSFMLGAYDSKPSSGKIIRITQNKRILFYPPGGKNFVPVRDVVQAIIQSIDHPFNINKLLIAHENMSYKAFFKLVNRINNSKQILIPVPWFLLITAGYIGEILRKFSIPTSLSVTNMRILCTKNYYSNERSVNTLNLKYTSVHHSIVEAIQYWDNEK